MFHFLWYSFIYRPVRCGFRLGCSCFRIVLYCKYIKRDHKTNRSVGFCFHFCHWCILTCSVGIVSPVKDSECMKTIHKVFFPDFCRQLVRGLLSDDLVCSFSFRIVPALFVAFVRYLVFGWCLPLYIHSEDHGYQVYPRSH